MLKRSNQVAAYFVKTQQKPFFHHFPTISDHFPGRPESGLVARIRYFAIFAGRAANKKW
jgi:hypothetical protein